jgi:hypothetical protein
VAAATIHATRSLSSKGMCMLSNAVTGNLVTHTHGTAGKSCAHLLPASRLLRRHWAPALWRWRPRLLPPPAATATATASSAATQPLCTPYLHNKHPRTSSPWELPLTKQELIEGEKPGVTTCRTALRQREWVATCVGTVVHCAKPQTEADVFRTRCLRCIRRKTGVCLPPASTHACRRCC